MRVTMFAASCAIALAACSGGSDADEDASPADNSAAMPAAPDAPASQETALTGMPDGFLGRWDLSQADCAGSGSDMRLTVEPTHVAYYESAADLTQISQTAPNTITAEHAFAGEGDRWTETIGYELSDDGERLTVTTPGGDLTIRMRCG